MAYEPHNARRIRRSAVPYAPLSRHARLRKELLVGTLVGGGMLAVVGLYAATFRYQGVFDRTMQDAPRWSILDDGLIEKAKPVQTQFEKLKASVLAVSEAAKTRTAAAEALKKKLEARAATETPETP